MSHPIVKKIFVLVLLAALILPTVFYPKRAEADSNSNPISSTICAAYTATIGQLINMGAGYLGSLVGKVIGSAENKITGAATDITAVPVTDVTTQASVQAVQGQSAGNTAAINAKSDQQACEDFVNKVALATLKKRLIDTMTDEIITWINGGGSPKFITNFSQDVFQPALNQAVGDTVQQILPSLCSPFTFKINLELSAPQTLSQPSSCTLNSIVANFNDFRNNFNSGGIIGYNELLQPQNNPYGVDIITQDALYNNFQQVTAQNVLQTQVNVGFKSPELCKNWVVVNNQNHQILTTPKDIKNGDNSYNDPNNPPPMNDSTLSQAGFNTQSRRNLGTDLSQLSWQCHDLQVATPGRVLATGLEKSLYANLDLAINDPDITNALAMIADAAFNRLIKAGVQGVQGIIRTATTGGGSTNSADVTPEGVVNNAASGGLGDAINNTVSTVEQVSSNAKAAIISQLNQASGSLSDASTTLATASSTNQELIARVGVLITCLNRISTSTDMSWATSTLATSLFTASTTLPSYAAQISSTTITVNTLTALVNAQNTTQDTLNNNIQNISNAVSAASTVDTNINLALSDIQTNLGAAQTKLTQCQASEVGVR
jgi:hypothetical protein